MRFTLSAIAVPLLALGLATSPVLAQDTMAMDPAMDPMATECITKAEAETDAMKMDTMMTECGEMYPEAVAAHCMMKADMEADAMKKEEMAKACTEMYPDAMATGAM
jgi:hypothetical protein